MESYEVFAAAMFMLGAVSERRLRKYGKFISTAAGRYGPEAWPLLYQTDVRMRSEKVKHLCDALMAAHSEASGTPNLPRSRLRSFGSWWNLHFRELAALLPRLRLQLNALFLDGDVRVAKSHGQHLASTEVSLAEASRASAEPARHQPPHNPNTRRRRQPDPADYARVVRPRTDTAIQDGLHTTNCQGNPLCGDFHSGAWAFGVQGICPKDSNVRHQCTTCLSLEHGAHHPKPCQRTATSTADCAPRQAKGRGQKGGAKGNWSCSR